VYAVLWVIAWWVLNSLAMGVTGASSDWAATIAAATGVVTFLLAMLLAGVLFVFIAGAFSCWVWEALARETEMLLGHGTTYRPVAFVRGIKDSLGRLALAAVIWVAAWILGFFPTGGLLAGFLAVALLGTLDYTAPAYLGRGQSLSLQIARIWRLGWPGVELGLATAVLAGFPLLGVLFSPVLVVAGTLAVAEKEE